MREISKNDLHDVVLVGKGPELQLLFNIIGYNSSNFGKFGLNWNCINLYDESYKEFFSVLEYNRNDPKRSVNIDKFLKKECHDIKKLTYMNYEISREIAISFLKCCFHAVKIGVLK